MFFGGWKCAMTLRPGSLLSKNHLVTFYETTLFLYLSMFLNIFYTSTRRPTEPTRAFHNYGLYSLILDKIVKFKFSWITVGGSAEWKKSKNLPISCELWISFILAVCSHIRGRQMWHRYCGKYCNFPTRHTSVCTPKHFSPPPTLPQTIESMTRNASAG
jgi:hypothetical protein